MTELTMEEIDAMKPGRTKKLYGSDKHTTFQMSASGEEGRLRRAVFRIPRSELDTLDAFADEWFGGNRSETIRTAVGSLGRRLGLVQKSIARIKVEDLAAVIGRDPDKLANEQGVYDTPFHDTLEKIACEGQLITYSNRPSKTRALRWAVKVYLAEHT